MFFRTSTVLWLLGLGSLICSGLTLWLLSLHHAGRHSFNLDLGLSTCFLLAAAMGVAWALVFFIFKSEGG